MNYFWLTLKHKWFVLLAGIRVTCPLWRLITHDLSKFSYKEYFHYQRQFFGKGDEPEEFMYCWIHHQNVNDHHWEYWVPRTGHNRCYLPFDDNEPVNMYWNACLEMVADWLGASRAYEGKWPKRGDWEWMEENFDRLRLHKNTRKNVTSILSNYWMNPLGV